MENQAHQAPSPAPPPPQSLPTKTVPDPEKYGGIDTSHVPPSRYPRGHQAPSSPAPAPPTKTVPDPENYGGIDTQYESPSRSRYPRGILACTAVFLILAGVTVLTLWLIYRPENPSFTVVGAAVYALILTPSPLSSVAASIQFNIETKNPNQRVSIIYDHLTAVVSYHDQAITPPSELPPLFHETRSTLALSPVIGGGTAVPVTAETLNGLSSDLVGYGVVQLGVVVAGKLRWKAGLITTAPKTVHVTCHVAVSLKNGSSSGAGGQVPLLPSPNSCHFNV